MRSIERRAARLGRGERLLGVLSVVLVGAALVDGLLLAPPDAEMGDVQRLLYIHVPAAWIAYLSFAVVAVASVAYLKTQQVRWDRIGHASAEIGVLFTGLAIVLGSIWGRPTWGVWWSWDPRLTTTAILFLIYLGYLSVRRLTDDPRQRARWSAVIGIVGFVDVPIVHLSVTWWRSLHQPPSVLRPGSPTMAGSMLVALLLGVAAFSVLYLYLLVRRLRLERLASRLATEELALRLDERPVTVTEAAGG